MRAESVASEARAQSVEAAKSGPEARAQSVEAAKPRAEARAQSAEAAISGTEARAQSAEAAISTTKAMAQAPVVVAKVAHGVRICRFVWLARASSLRMTITTFPGPFIYPQRWVGQATQTCAILIA